MTPNGAENLPSLCFPGVVRLVVLGEAEALVEAIVSLTTAGQVE